VRSRILKSKTVFKGKLLKVRTDLVAEPGGVRAVREIVWHPGSVVVLPRLADGRIVLVRQYRHAAGRPLWELVAGGLEPGESLLAAARRELLEETGYRARRLRRLLSFFPSPGILTERMHLFEASGLALDTARPEADERLTLGRFTRRQLRQMVVTGRIADAKTLVGLLWTLGRRSGSP
jgi:ADP-ribose pyrophosphatase